MTPDERATELARLRRLLAARDGKAGYKANVEAIKIRIADLEREDAAEKVAD